MMRRQFINVVLRCHKTHSFNLHNIKSSSLFHPRKGNGCIIKQQQTQVEEEAKKFPKPALLLRILPRKEARSNGGCMFMPFGRDRALSVDLNGNVVAYDSRLNSICSMPMMQGSVSNSITFNVDEALYLLKRCPSKTDQIINEPCFQVLKDGHPPPDVYMVPSWHWRSLPPPPYVEAPRYKPSFDSMISSSTLFADNIWVSAIGIGTYAFDTVKSSWSKAGSWELPFDGRAEYVSQLNLWFGFSSGRKKPFFCASDLSAASASGAPKLCHVWKEELAANSKDWVLLDSFLVHVGNGRFCIARFYNVYEDNQEICGYPVVREKFAVFTGVVVERCKVDGGIQMVQHKSLRYEFDCCVLEWVF